MASGLVPKYTAAILLNAPIVSDGEHRISVLVPSRLLMNTRMRTSEAVALGDEAAFLLPWVVSFFSMRDPITVEALSADLWCLARGLGEWRGVFVGCV